MTDQETLDQLIAHTRETALLSSVQNLVWWDEQTCLPKRGAEYRAEQCAYLAGEVHKRKTAPEVGDWLEELAGSQLAADPASDAGCTITQLKRTRDKLAKTPQSLVEEIARAASKSHHAWVEARKNDDFATFAPYLEEMLRLRRQQAEAIGYDDSPYDTLLDEYEPGATAAAVAPVLEALGEQLKPLVAAIVGSETQAPSELVRRSFPVAAQEAFGKAAAEAIGFDFGAGRLDVAAHPFCSEIGAGDVRLTTRYQEHDFCDGFFSILHEAGHGLYEQGLPREWFGLPPGQFISLAIHESQSRMWENLVGRSRGFWRRHFEPAQKAFPAALSGVDPDAWWFAINEARPSLIRTESDEATYNQHIVVRFRLERALVEGDLSVADLPTAWNDGYRDVLGVEVPNDADGVLQDVHWSEGMFGYFPTYALGNLYASQLFEHAGRELGDLEAAFAAGEYATLLGWLRTKVHAVGQRQSAAQLIESVTGRPLSAEPLLAHLRAKFGELYRL